MPATNSTPSNSMYPFGTCWCTVSASLWLPATILTRPRATTRTGSSGVPPAGFEFQARVESSPMPSGG
ncbi:MAG: hypothetical protein R3F34_06660 [Planctomycetota bacterium]